MDLIHSHRRIGVFVDLKHRVGVDGSLICVYQGILLPLSCLWQVTLMVLVALVARCSLSVVECKHVIDSGRLCMWRVSRPAFVLLHDFNELLLASVLSHVQVLHFVGRLSRIHLLMHLQHFIVLPIVSWIRVIDRAILPKRLLTLTTCDRRLNGISPGMVPIERVLTHFWIGLVCSRVGLLFLKLLLLHQ